MSGTAKRREEQRQALWDKWIVLNAVQTSKLGRYGDKIYANILAVMSAYRSGLEMYQTGRESVITPAVRDILEGIYNVLTAQLKEIPGVNPVAEENNSVCQNILAGLPVTAPRERCAEGVKLCAAALDDLSARPVIQSYIDMTSSEWDVMSSLIKVQVSALEAALPFASDGEQVLVNNILTGLRESYQHFGRAVTELNDVLRGDGTLSFPREDASFNEALKQEVFAVADKERVKYVRAAYQFQRLFGEESLLASDIVTLFENLYKALPDTAPLPPEAEVQAAILSGVRETIEIKIESLRESAAYFTESGKQLITSFATDRKAFTEEELAAFYGRAARLWQEDPFAFFERIEEDELIAENKAYHEKRIAEYTEKTDKSLLRFKKETLLYEICTYEEILTHSVSRLRESDTELITQAVALLDETFAALEVLLKKNNIEVIHPLPHQMFNGRENEVLVAEKQEGFNKGEIVKTINSGYKQKDVIILRANVVAAR